MSPSAVSRDSSPSKPSSWRRASSRSSSFSSDSRSTAMGPLPSVRNSQRAPRARLFYRLAAHGRVHLDPRARRHRLPVQLVADGQMAAGETGLAAQHDEFDAVAVGAQPALLGLVARSPRTGFPAAGRSPRSDTGQCFPGHGSGPADPRGSGRDRRLTARPAWPAAARCRRACPRRRRGWAGPARCGVRRRPGRCARRPATGPAVDREDGAEQGQRGHQDCSQPAVAAEPMARAPRLVASTASHVSRVLRQARETAIST